MIAKIKTEKVKKEKSKVYMNKIKATLTEIGMSQQELADKIGSNPAHLSRIINGQRRCISLPIAMKIASALGKTVEDLFQDYKND